MDGKRAFELLKTKPSESDGDCLDALSRTISRLSGYDETELIPKDASVFLRRLRLESSDAEYTDASIRLLHQAHSAAVALARSLQDGLAYLNGQKGTVHSVTTQLKKTSGIDALPDDIIAMVAEQVKKSADQLMVVHFSHVCQRWRNISLSIPQLWCSSSSSFDHALVQTLLTRSKAAPLDIDLYCNSNEMSFNEDLLKYLEEVKPHFGRCRFLKVVLEADWSVEAMLGLSEALGIYCNGLHAPVLEMLVIECYTFDDRENRNISRDARFHFYASWNMPQLRSLRITNFIPRPVFGNALKSLEVEFTMDPGSEEWDMQLLLDFLASVPELKDLSIILLNSVFRFFDSGNSSQRNRIVLGNLAALTLDISGGQFDRLGSLRTLLRWIITPNITKLTLNVDVATWSEANDFLELLFVDTEDNRFVHVERLDIHLRRLIELERRCRMEQIFFKLPRLADLSLSVYDESEGTTLWDLPSHPRSFYSAKGLAPNPNERSVSLPPLRFVRLSGFKDVSNFSFDAARILVYAMEDGKHWEQLERMEIIGCPSFKRTKNELVEIIPQGKLLWID